MVNLPQNWDENKENTWNQHLEIHDKNLAVGFLPSKLQVYLLCFPGKSVWKSVGFQKNSMGMGVYIYIYTWSLQSTLIFGVVLKEWYFLKKVLFNLRKAFFDWQSDRRIRQEANDIKWHLEDSMGTCVYRSFGQFGDNRKLVEPFAISKVHVETPPSRLRALMTRTYWDQLVNSRCFFHFLAMCHLLYCANGFGSKSECHWNHIIFGHGVQYLE